MTATRVEAGSGIAAAAEALRGAQNIALFGHVNPDADCLGAMGALSIALAELGKHTWLSLPMGTVARRLTWLVQHAGMRPATEAELLACDLAVVLDTAKLRRVNYSGSVDALGAVRMLNIDHHATNPNFGQVNWVESQRSSTCEMAYELVRHLGCAITPTIATLLFSGLHGDTKGFSLSNTTPACLEAAATLARHGARISQVCERLHRSLSKEEFELLSLVFRNTRVSPDGRIAWSTASLAEIVSTGCSASTIDDQVEVPRMIEDICIAILLTEAEPGVVRANFRGEGTFQVVDLAREFEGGGHAHSAGAMIRGAFEQVVQRVLKAAQAYVDRVAR